ncbi:glycoside hydrolase family 66 protein [Neobacillus sp. PS3-34]|uniref:glycoside hydrolase family 66 protein n=1 Tax=Neobacillus sp. PS3-34 TaxID=3070678 RepID=UPI0027DF578A|nr:glycoside hydrolase family 66 protein [Neobacillus sp. PS3-34]WML48158.1 glycoside hydrolase family 66 protein [Neobacillus sp. PS3-34]
MGTVWSIAKQKENKYKIVHLVNFSDSLTMEWRDTYGSTPTPTAKQNINIMLDEVRPIKSMWIATPDDGLGLPQKINFIQKKEEVFFRIPSLKYWDMVVMEF